MKLKVIISSSLTNKGISKNGTLLFANDEKYDFLELAKHIYKQTNSEYPKFFKMDELCKLAFLTTEVLLKDQILNRNEDGTDIAIVLANKDASAASDLRHVETLVDQETYFPSPAVFVYTLPNIMLGEICIRHQIRGENSCFIMESFDTDFMFEYIKNLFENEGYQYCITGWVNYTADEYSASLCLISKDGSFGSNQKEFKRDFNKI